MNKRYLALFTALTLSAGVFAQTAPLTIPQPVQFDQLTQPSADVSMPEAYVKAIAQQAYIWGWPMVSRLASRT